MTGRLRWWWCRLQYAATQQELFRWITHPRLVRPFFLAQMNWAIRKTMFVLCAVTQARKIGCLFYFICITGFIKCLKIDIWICLWWTGKKLVTLLAARIRLQDCSQIKAIDFSWRSWTSFGEGGQQVLHEKRDGVRQDVCTTNSIGIREECKEQQIT